MDGVEPSRQLLIVDDDHSLILAFARGLKRTFTVLGASSGEEAIELARTKRPGLIMVDVFLGDESGIELISKMASKFPGLPIIAMSASEAPPLIVDAIKSGAVDYLVKPFADSFAKLVAHLESLFRTEAMSLSLHDVKREHIARVFRAADYNVSEAARRLGLKRSSLQRMLRKYGLVPARLRTLR